MGKTPVDVDQKKISCQIMRHALRGRGPLAGMSDDDRDPADIAHFENIQRMLARYGLEIVRQPG
jgi:hypothetical protein